ncbi:flagellar hook capping FlgD N-terminal domain-containing protein [Paracoccus sp. NGMCC 1.201697]|uniref:Basal-body rod modification protein FlgD n=1 Tax=Paracoccus broussonetiae subsp. drimophilus TaxID=3373869 RepID=A0ABW7LLS9_9RHOB
MVTGIGTTYGSSTTANSAASTTSATSVGGDYQTFLRMLTTQVQSQDPLNPMDSSDFAVQLATFSGVEQQVRTNSLLEQMVSGSNGQLGQLADWIGREVRTTGPVWFQGEPLTLQIDPTAGADAAQLVTLDATGNEVGREAIGTGAGEVDWLAQDQSGAVLPDGLYQFRLDSLSGGEVIGSTQVPAYSRVTGAELSDAGPLLILTGNSAVSPSEVTALRE